LDPHLITNQKLLKKGILLNLRMGLFMMEIGRETLERVMVSRFGQMVPNIKENGLIIRRKARENLFMLTETSMMEIGNKTKHLDMESTYITMELDMKVIGSTTISMDMVSKLGLMEVSIKETTNKVKKMVKENTCGKMEAITMEIG
jgi:hypothetical protein